MTAIEILTALTHTADEAKAEYEKAKDAETKAEKSLQAAVEMYSLVVKTAAKDSRVAAIQKNAKDALDAAEYTLQTVRECLAEYAEKASKATKLLEDAEVLLLDMNK